MSLGNPRSIVKQTILLCNFLRNILLMISPRYWYLSTVFLITVLSTLINPLSYLVALLFCGLALILLLSKNSLSGNYLNWRVKGGIRGTISLVCLIAICLIVPQVETNVALFTSPINHLKNDLRFT